MSREIIVVLDFGSQYTHLIKSAYEAMGIESEIVAADTVQKQYLSQLNGTMKGIVLSGGAASVSADEIEFDSTWLDSGVPTLGLCYGHQLLAKHFGGELGAEKSEFGPARILIAESNEDRGLFSGIHETALSVWMSHNDSVVSASDFFEVTAYSENGAVAGLQNTDRKIYSVQFHPEVSHTLHGSEMLSNFAVGICEISASEKWTPQKFVERMSAEITATIGDRKVIIGLSGGVDSYTMTKLIRDSVRRDQLFAVYIDSGLMPDETEAEVRTFCSDNDIELMVSDEAGRFFSDLQGVTEAFDKCKTIGKSFIDAFEEIAQIQGAEVFAQGTIWSDVIESGVTKFSSQIKPHHNVGGLPERLNFELMEPLRQLFKNQVREIAAFYNLPSYVVHKKVFPGPGFAIRVQGEVTADKVALVRKSTFIVENIINQSPISNDVWMAFSILVDVPSLGVKGDKHVKNEHALVIRAVESTNSMTANFSTKVFPYLGEISRKITDELEVGRVVYDITNKPPGTIEWQ